MRYTVRMNTQPSEQALRRQYEDTLVITGTGVMAFGVWSLAKTVVVAVLRMDLLMWEVFGREVSGKEALLFFFVLGVMLLIDLVIRLRLGLAARAEGHGKSGQKTSLVLATLLAIPSLASILFSLFSFITGSHSPFELVDMVVTVAIELTSFVLLVEMIMAVVRLRALRASSQPMGSEGHGNE